MPGLTYPFAFECESCGTEATVTRTEAPVLAARWIDVLIVEVLPVCTVLVCLWNLLDSSDSVRISFYT